MSERRSRREFMAATGAGLAAATLSRASTAQQRGDTKQRNIVYILVDDQRYDALGLHHPYWQTPHLDALARNGILFEKCFVTTSLCSPSRASILTGRYAHAHGVLDNRTPLPQSLPTFPKELQRGGYETAFVGKWHMGGGSDEPRPGFDRWVSFRGQGVYKNPTFNIDGEKVAHKGHVTDLITDYAEEFLRKSHDKPFCLYVSHKAVHAMFEPADRHVGSYDGKAYPYPDTMANTEENYRGKPDWVRAQRNSWHGVDAMYNHEMEMDVFTQAYAETLRSVDDSVGRIVATLREQGLLESTLLVFTSDNGFQFGEHGLIDKRTMYEASIRVPLIVHCPELFEGGQRRNELITNIDFAPTFLQAAGLPIPDAMQGLSFYNLLDGSSSEWRDAFLYEYFWERSFPQTPTVLGVRTDRYKLMKFHGVWDRYEMYDLQEDPDEKHNLVGNVVIEGHAGQLDGHIQRRGDREVRDIFSAHLKRLNELLAETGAAQEPNWRIAPPLP